MPRAVIAQARWAAHHAFIEIAPEVIQDKSAFEARSWHHFYAGEWKSALTAAKGWLIDQPFSVNPAIHASYVAAVGLNDHAEALSIAEYGLRANPHDPSLLNNRAWALSHLGHYPEAVATLSQARKATRDTTANIKPALLATAGLIYYRIGEIGRGRESYQAAVASANKMGDKRLAARAALFLPLKNAESKRLLHRSFNWQKP